MKLFIFKSKNHLPAVIFLIGYTSYTQLTYVQKIILKMHSIISITMSFLKKTFILYSFALWLCVLHTALYPVRQIYGIYEMGNGGYNNCVFFSLEHLK